MLVFEQFDDTSLMVLYLLLLGNNKNLFIYMNKTTGYTMRCAFIYCNICLWIC